MLIPPQAKDSSECAETSISYRSGQTRTAPASTRLGIWIYLLLIGTNSVQMAQGHGRQCYRDKNTAQSVTVSCFTDLAGQYLPESMRFSLPCSGLQCDEYLGDEFPIICGLLNSSIWGMLPLEQMASYTYECLLRLMADSLHRFDRHN